MTDIFTPESVEEMVKRLREREQHVVDVNAGVEPLVGYRDPTAKELEAAAMLEALAADRKKLREALESMTEAGMAYVPGADPSYCRNIARNVWFSMLSAAPPAPASTTKAERR